MTAHIGDLAELYALGALDLGERRALEAHVLQCTECTDRLREAEASFLTLAENDSQRDVSARLTDRISASLATQPSTAGAATWTQRPWARPLLAMAAVLAIAIIPSYELLGHNRAMQTQLATDDAAFARMAAGPIAHATFKGRTARVIYSADGTWYYVIVMHPSSDMRIAYIHNGTTEVLGSITMHGSTGTLYLPVSEKMDNLAILQGGRVVADANLAY